MLRASIGAEMVSLQAIARTKRIVLGELKSGKIGGEMAWTKRRGENISGFDGYLPL